MTKLSFKHRINLLVAVKEIDMEKKDFSTEFVFEAFEDISEFDKNIMLLEPFSSRNFIFSVFQGFEKTIKLSEFIEHKIINIIAVKTCVVINKVRFNKLKLNSQLSELILKSAYYIKLLCANLDGSVNSELVENIKEHLAVLDKAINFEKDSKVSNSKTDKASAVLVSKEKGLFSSNNKKLFDEDYLVIISGLNIDEKNSGKVDEIISISNNITELLVNYLLIEQAITIKEISNQLSEISDAQFSIQKYMIADYDNNVINESTSKISKITKYLQNLYRCLSRTNLKNVFQYTKENALLANKDLNKNVEINISGEDTEINRALLLNDLSDSLIHMTYNSLFHGIEKEKDRIKFDKNVKAEITLNAYNKKDKVIIEVNDDGKGIDTDNLHKKAVEEEIINEEKNYTEQEKINLAMYPGLTTYKTAKKGYVGLGRALSAIRRRLLKLSGKIKIKTVLNKGTSFKLEVPKELDLFAGTVVNIGFEYFVIPDKYIKTILPVKDFLPDFVDNKESTLKLAGEVIPVVNLSNFFNHLKKFKQFNYFVILQLDKELISVPIINIVNKEEIITKQTVNNRFSHLNYVSGVTVIESGKAALILNIKSLFKNIVNF